MSSNNPQAATLAARGGRGDFTAGGLYHARRRARVSFAGRTHA